MKNLFDYDEFVKEHAEMYDKCTYPYYRNKCVGIAKKLFYGQDASQEELIFLARKTGIEIDIWCKKIQEYQYDKRFCCTEESGIWGICIAP